MASTRSLSLRPLRGSLAPLPLCRVDAQGQPHRLADLHLLHPDGVKLTFLAPFGWPLDAAMREGRFEGLPYPLQDMRPQGFLGRYFARFYGPVLQVSTDPHQWSDDDALHAISLLGSDTPGDLLVGERACAQWLEHLRLFNAGQTPPGISDDDVPAAFPSLARLVLTDGLPGSSAGGEFPKFTTMRRMPDGSLRHVLVKFTADDDSPATRRWADLLVCEHLASRVLVEHLRIPAAASRLHVHENRTFLEIDRFDRHGALGRSPVVSWFALNATFIGTAGQPWHQAVRPLVDRGWLSKGDQSVIEQVWHFGRLIDNNDMHDGNLSFRPIQRAGHEVFELAPIYDMLPMGLAPRRDGTLPVERSVHLNPSARPVEADALIHRVEDAARWFWRTASEDARLSPTFRQLCEARARRLTLDNPPIADHRA